jgi:amino acid adenylation domain-containing protein
MSINLLEYSFTRGPNVPLEVQEIHHAFIGQAKKNPELIAAVHGEDSLTYGQLDVLSDHLKKEIEKLGGKPGENIGIFLERSCSMLVGIMGILKSGSAYVPQDARVTPVSTLHHIAESSKIKIIFTLSHLKHRIPQNLGLKVLELDTLIKEFKQRDPIKDQEVQTNPNGRCFVLYTSGTTGFPNGVQVTHQNVCNLLLTQPGNLNVKKGQTVSQILNISFDMCAWEIFVALSHGAKLFIREKSISAAIAQADIVISTPSILADIDATQNQHVKVVAVAGEPCPKSLANAWSEFCDFYNCCGPTETTIVNTMKLYQKDEGKITIGKPTPNNTVYILDENLNPLPYGEIGEMWAGGDCVTAGYINNPKLTKERYLPDPFLGEGKLMFRTRDLGRWTPEGELEHFGRTDDQVKIRGFRVELDSISSALEKFGGCAQAITLKLDDRNLISFVTPSTLSLENARNAIREILPYYCIPQMIIPLDRFPKTNRGKIDKKALTVLGVKLQEQFLKTQKIPQEVTV